MNRQSTQSGAALQQKYRLGILVFLLGVLVLFVAFNTVVKGVNTLQRLDEVESERDQWQKAPEVIAALHLKDGSDVADVGSGSGYFALKLSSVVGARGQVSAVDIRPFPLVFVWIRAMFRGRHNIRVQLGDPDDPHLPEGRLDAILIANTYHELANPASILAHGFIALKRDGRLVVLDRSRTPHGPAEAPDHHHEIASESVSGQIRRAGFEIVSEQDQFIDRPNGERWWLIVAIRVSK